MAKVKNRNQYDLIIKAKGQSVGELAVTREGTTFFIDRIFGDTIMATFVMEAEELKELAEHFKL